MNKAKLNNYKLTGSIHTISVKSDGIINDDMEEDVRQCIKCSSQVRNGDETTTSIINVNKLNGDVLTFSEFDATFNTILGAAGIEQYKIVRADMRLDSYDPEHYERYAKLNRYLISLLAVTYKVENCYKTDDLFSQKQRSIAIKNKYFQIENYDKDAESGGLDMAQSRLEERSLSWKNEDLQKEFVDRWCFRWTKALKNTELVWKRYNDALEQRYKEGKDAYPKQFRSLTDFLIQHQNCIFCKKQMIDLLSRFDEVGAAGAKTRAENHKKRYGIEYFSQKDLETAVNEIQRATREFFES